MNRREAIKTVVTTALGIPIALNAGAPDDRLGFVDVTRHTAFKKQGIWLRVMLNGEDVTDRCQEADDIEGYVILVKLNYKGTPYLDANELAREVRVGEVRFRRVEPWDAELRDAI